MPFRKRFFRRIPCCHQDQSENTSFEGFCCCSRIRTATLVQIITVNAIIFLAVYYFSVFDTDCNHKKAEYESWYPEWIYRTYCVINQISLVWYVFCLTVLANVMIFFGKVICEVSPYQPVAIHPPATSQTTHSVRTNTNTTNSDAAEHIENQIDCDQMEKGVARVQV